MQISDSKLNMGLAWLMIAASSIVFIEPSVSDVLCIGALGLFFAQGMRMPRGARTAGVFILVYLVANLAAASMAPEPLTAIRSLSIRFYMAAAWLLFTCLIYENPEKVVATVWNAYTVAALIAITAGIIGYYDIFGANDQLIENGRVRAFFKDPNVYGPFIVPVAIYAFARLETANTRQLLVCGLLFAYCAFGILLGFSRGSWINLTVALALFLLVRLATQRQRLLRQRMVRIAAGALIGSAILIVGLASTDRVQEMLDKRLKVVQYYDMGKGGRLTNQLEIVKSIAVKPLGIGPGQSEQDYFFDMAPHNLYLHVLIESGWIGGFAFFAFAALTLARGWRFLHKASNVDGIHIASYACVAGVLAQSFFVDSTHWRHFFLLIAMVWGPLLAWEARLAQKQAGAHQASMLRRAPAAGIARKI